MRRSHALLIAAGLAAASTSAVAGPSPDDPKTGAPVAAAVTDKQGKPAAGAPADRQARATDPARRSVMDTGPGWLRAMLRPLVELRDRSSSKEARHDSATPSTTSRSAAAATDRGDG